MFCLSTNLYCHIENLALFVYAKGVRVMLNISFADERLEGILIG